VLSGPATSRLREPPLDELVVTDTIPLGSEAAALEKITVLPVAPLLAEAIRRTHDEASISSLFV
jgi:ribose-phosphate pyrophosphokinase